MCFSFMWEFGYVFILLSYEYFHIINWLSNGLLNTLTLKVFAGLKNSSTFDL